MGECLVPLDTLTLRKMMGGACMASRAACTPEKDVAETETQKGTAMMTGRHFDEWIVGERLTHNPQPPHIDVEAAKASEFGQIQLVRSSGRAVHRR